MPAKFVIKKGATGKFRFTLNSPNGQVIATSQPYNTKAACMNGVRAVQRSAPEAAAEDQTTKAWAAAELERKAAEAAKKAKKPVAKLAGATKQAAKAVARKAPTKNAATKKA